MSERVTTPNILEVTYLLERQHRIVNVKTATSWPYGINELVVTLEGKGIGLDRDNFKRHGVISFVRISKAMDAIQLVIAQKIEGAIL